MTAQSETNNPQIPNLRVLLIEDKPGEIRLIQEMLAEIKSGVTFEIKDADNLSTGLRRLSDGGFDVILLDLGLPDSQGLETLKRAQEKAAGVPIVVLTGLTDERVGANAVKEGAQDYLIKGQINSNLLARTLSYAIERNRAENTLKKYSRDLEEKLFRLEKRGFSRYDFLVKEKNSYIIKEKGYNKSLAIFSNLTKFGFNGLCLTMTNLDILSEIYNLKDLGVKIIRISAAGGKENVISPTGINGMIVEFIKNNKNSMVLFLGFESIIILNGIEKSLNLLNIIIDSISANDSRLIIAVDPEAMIPRELSLIEKSLIEIKDDDLIFMGLK